MAAAELLEKLSARHVRAHSDIMHAYTPWKGPDTADLLLLPPWRLASGCGSAGGKGALDMQLTAARSVWHPAIRGRPPGVRVCANEAPKGGVQGSSQS